MTHRRSSLRDGSRSQCYGRSIHACITWSQSGWEPPGWKVSPAMSSAWPLPTVSLRANSSCMSSPPHLHRAAQAKTDVLRNGAISRLLSFSGSLNGFSSLTQQLVDGLSVLTGRTDLHCLTFLPLKEIFSQVKLLRRVRAWCPWCFESWQEAGTPIYEPLLWNLETLDICPLHGPLSTHCPYPDCARTSVCLTSQSSVGFCSRCQRWLGVPPSWRRKRRRFARDPEAWKQQQSMATMLGEVLAQAPLFPAPLSRVKAMRLVASHIDGSLQGDYEQAARHFGITESTLRDWLTGASVPQINLFLHLCLSLDVSLMALLDGSASALSFAQQSITVRDMSKRPRHVTRKFPKRHVEKALQKAILKPQDPPISLYKLAKRLGSSPERIVSYFPELSAALTAQYHAAMGNKREQTFLHNCEEVAQAMLFLHENGIYPSRYRLKQVLSRPSIVRRPAIIAFMKATLREMGYV